MRHPNAVHLSLKKCPECRESLSAARLERGEGHVEALCPNGSCSYRIPLFWLGDGRASMN